MDIEDYIMVKLQIVFLREKIRYREDILDNMGSDELIVNIFRISQTEQKLKNANIKLKSDANKTHYEVGKNKKNYRGIGKYFT